MFMKMEKFEGKRFSPIKTNYILNKLFLTIYIMLPAYYTIFCIKSVQLQTILYWV